MGRGGHNRLTLDRVKELYENENREILEIERREVGNQGKKRTYVKYKCLIDKYEDWVILGNLSKDQGCSKCAGKILTLDEIKNKLKDINTNIEITDDKYINNETKLQCRCLIDNHEWTASWGNLQKGSGCPKCSGQVLHNGNILYINRPDLIKYFVNLEDAKNYISSSKKVQLKCPECGLTKSKLISLNYLSSKGFSCEYCSDGASMPEKFIKYLLLQLNLEFESQKLFNWSNKKRYDFYFNNKIIEAHGKQHYESSFLGMRNSRTLEDERINDKIKYELAIKNGIKIENYIVIDCRNSELEWLKNNCIWKLSNHFDLSNINWNGIWEDCQSSIVVKVWEAWNNRSENDTVKTISETFNLDKTTVIKYLKRGNEIGKCNYNLEENLLKRNKRIVELGIMNGKKVYQYNLGNEYLKNFNSCMDASRQLKVSNHNISSCCRKGTRLSAYGFKWSYNPPINGMYPD